MNQALWDMVDGPMPRGLLGLGDPDLHLIDGIWTLFVGGFSTTFRNRLYRARLGSGGSIGSGPWQFDLDRRGRVQPLCADAPRGSWDAAGLHTPSYVPPVAGNSARIYYTGRSSLKQYGPGSSYSIGVLEHSATGWRRLESPVLQGVHPRTSVLEPFVIHTGDRYRMWYQANPHEIGPGELPDYELRCVDSTDGIRWSDPVVFAGPDEGFFDNTVVQGPEQWYMVLARGSNLHNTPDFPAQGLWLITAPTPSANRADWSSPRRLLDTDRPDTPAWLGRGTYGPAAVFTDRLTILTTGVRSTPRWPRLVLQHLLSFKRPPVPAPFYLATGSIQQVLEITGEHVPETGHPQDPAAEPS